MGLDFMDALEVEVERLAGDASVRAVVIRGAVTSLDHRQLELFRRYRELDEERPAFKRPGF